MWVSTPMSPPRGTQYHSPERKSASRPRAPQYRDGSGEPSTTSRGGGSLDGGGRPSSASPPPDPVLSPGPGAPGAVDDGVRRRSVGAGPADDGGPEARPRVVAGAVTRPPRPAGSWPGAAADARLRGA